MKRKISRIHQSLAVLAAIFLVIFFAGCGPPKKADEVGTPGAPRAPRDMPCYQQLGITLSGAEWEGGDYIRPTTAELSYYASKGVKLIRLEIRWDKVQPDLYGQLNGDEITWLKTYVADADKQNMSVIIDLHERSNLDDLNFGPELPIASLMFADSGLRTNPITKEYFTEFGRSRPILLSLQSGQSITSISYS